MENSTKKIATLFSCAAFILITAGVTVAFFQYIGIGISTNTITTGNIAFHYQELDGKGHGISITNAMPVSSNENAKSTVSAFNFDITSKTIEKVVIPYTVTARLDKNADEVMGDIVDLYLTEVNGNSENPTDLFSGTLPKYNELEQYDGVEGYTEKIIYEGEVPANTANYKKNFRLRMWIDQNANYGKQCSINPSVNDTQEKCSTANGAWNYRYNNKTFSITVNIYAQGSKQQPGRRLLAAIKAPLDGDPSTGGLPTPVIDPNDAEHRDNNDCDPSTDTTCRACDPSTDPKCGTDNKKRDKCTDYEDGICLRDDDDDDGDGEDDDIYYYRGDDVDNYVKFGDDETLWRVVRVNGDNTIRMVRTAPISTLGYQYNTMSNPMDTFYYTNSLVRGPLNEWYSLNIIANDLDSYVASGNYFCEQFKVAGVTPFIPSGSTVTDLTTGTYIYNYDCSSDKLINAKIGLLTLDEVKLANPEFFDFIGSSNAAWTMSPAGYYNSNQAFLFYQMGSTIQYAPANGGMKLYPVINLKSDVMFTGTGKQDDPFVVVLNNPVSTPTNKTLTELVMEDNPSRLTKTNFVYADGSGFYQMNVTNGFGGTNGTSYYFRGDVKNNIVKFANKTWQIVRINEDGTVRLLLKLDDLNGLSTIYTDTCTNGVDCMYYTNSTIKGELEDWYDENITGSDNLKVAEGNYFCEAFKVKYACSDVLQTGNATVACLSYDHNPNGYYEGYTPDLKCNTDGNGYGLVSGKIALMSYDEAVLAGLPLYMKNNTSYYVYHGVSSITFTMSPSGYRTSNNGYSALIWDFNSYLSQAHGGDERIIKPVINLKANTIATRKIDTTNNSIYYEVN